MLLSNWMQISFQCVHMYMFYISEVDIFSCSHFSLLTCNKYGESFHLSISIARNIISIRKRLASCGTLCEKNGRKLDFHTKRTNSTTAANNVRNTINLQNVWKTNESRPIYACLIIKILCKNFAKSSTRAQILILN